MIPRIARPHHIHETRLNRTYHAQPLYWKAATIGFMAQQWSGAAFERNGLPPYQAPTDLQLDLDKKLLSFTVFAHVDWNPQVMYPVRHLILQYTIAGPLDSFPTLLHVIRKGMDPTCPENEAFRWTLHEWSADLTKRWRAKDHHMTNILRSLRQRGFFASYPPGAITLLDPSPEDGQLSLVSTSGTLSLTQHPPK